jgi:hypothetical protein
MSSTLHVRSVCAKCHRISILRNLTDIRQKASVGFSICMARVPVAYHRSGERNAVKYCHVNMARCAKVFAVELRYLRLCM